MHEVFCCGRSLPSGHQVCEVELFDEALDVGSLANLSLGHGTGDLSGVHIDSSHDSMGEGTLLSSLLVA